MFGHWCLLSHLETKTLCNSRKVGLETKPIQTGWITGIQIVDKCLLQNQYYFILGSDKTYVYNV